MTTTIKTSKVSLYPLHKIVLASEVMHKSEMWLREFPGGLCAFTVEGAGSTPGQKDPSSNEPWQKKKKRKESNLAEYKMVSLNKDYPFLFE